MTRFFQLILFSLLVILTACAPSNEGLTEDGITEGETAVSPSATPITTPTTPRPTEPFMDNVDIGGYSLFMKCEGSGDVTVLFEAGAGAPFSSWGELPPAISAKTRVCRYDRAGIGNSDPSPTTPRTGQVIADELYTLLQNSGETAPYLLVAHSLGGLSTRLFAATHPAEVVGMILLDSTQEDFIDFLQAEMTPEEFENYQTNILSNLELDMPLTRTEIHALNDTAEFPLADLPLVVIARNVQPPNPSLTDAQSQGKARRMASVTSRFSQTI